MHAHPSGGPYAPPYAHTRQESDDVTELLDLGAYTADQPRLEPVAIRRAEEEVEEGLLLLRDNEKMIACELPLEASYAESATIP